MFLRFNKNLKLFIIFFILSCVNIFPYQNANEHASEWLEILGLDHKYKRELKQFSTIIDRWQDFYRRINRDFPSFTWGDYGHRILFHWGFSDHPKRSQALVKQLKECGIQGEERIRFYRLVLKEQQKRNQEMQTIIGRIYGSSNRSKKLTAIIYNIHILQDYVPNKNKKTDALLNKDLVYKRIIDDIEYVLGSVNSKKICIKLKEARNPDPTDFLNILKSDFPVLVQKRFSRAGR